MTLQERLLESLLEIRGLLTREKGVSPIRKIRHPAKPSIKNKVVLFTMLCKYNTSVPEKKDELSPFPAKPEFRARNFQTQHHKKLSFD